MPGYLAGALGLTSRHSLNITAWLSHHVLLAVLVAIGIIVAFLLMLAIPVMSTASYYRFSSSFRRSALPTFLVGFGVLIVGLASSVRIIELAGGGIMATVVIGLIIDQYLTPHPPHRTQTPHTRQLTLPRGTTHCTGWPVTSAISSKSLS